MTVGQNNTPTASYQATPGEEKEIYIEPSVDSLLPYNSNIDLLHPLAQEELKQRLYMGEELLTVIPRASENKIYIPLIIFYIFFILMNLLFSVIQGISYSLIFGLEMFGVIFLFLTAVFVFLITFAYIMICSKGINIDFIAVTKDRIFLSEESCYSHDKNGIRIEQINPKSIQFRNIDDIKVKFSYITFVYSCHIYLKEGWRTHYESKYAVYDFYLFATKKKEEMDKYLNIINHIRDEYWEIYDKKKLETTPKYVPEPLW
eukprot:TRINITY_DN152_c0_g1_i2.p1 TRINITY_DN152_c0_g1~~TRINITY_DN152_c0_g1_i2.p1  ORF type:complete len:260 (-),score=40.48 TRINITY_DN152_c0_g1_i2:359-1138(-)